MIDLITSYVFNGSITGFTGYAKWLPFYDYGYYILGLLFISFTFGIVGYKFLHNVFKYFCI